MTALVFGVLALMPPPMLYVIGGMFLCAGAAGLFAGFYIAHHRRGKFYLEAGVLFVIAGLIVVLFPTHPLWAGVLLFVFVFVLIWIVGNILWAIILA